MEGYSAEQIERSEQNVGTRYYFVARQPVRWLAPIEVLHGARGEFFGGLFSKYSDNRERIALSRPAVIHAEAATVSPIDPPSNELQFDPIRWRHADWERAPFTFDYVADIGDGFGATYAIAELLAKPNLRLADENGGRLDLTRGELLVFGGDQVYPVADPVSYRDRTIGPYTLAFGDAARTPVLAIPGNHDWYDGLSSFLEIFTVPRPVEQPELGSVGLPWDRRQTRSYFAAELRHGWWIWGADTGLDDATRVHQSQLDYFNDARKLLGPDDKVLLCVGEPSWLKRKSHDENREPDGWDRLVESLHLIFEGDPWETVELIVAGDKHYYARHESSEPEDAPVLVTAGGGGAYLSSTMDASRSLRLNVANLDRVAGGDENTADYERIGVWPNTRTSLLTGALGLARVPLTNPTFASVFSVLFGLYSYLVLTGWRRPSFARARPLQVTLDSLASDGIVDGFQTAVVGLLVSLGGFVFALVVLAAIAFHAWVATEKRLGRAILAGLTHLALQGFAMVASLLLAARLVWDSTGVEQVRWGRVVALLVVTTALIAVPVLWNWLWYSVLEWTQLVLFVPSAIVLGLVAFVGVETAETGTITVIVATAIIGGGFGLIAFTSFLVVGQLFKVGLNELFVGIRHAGYKHFLRIVIDEKALKIHVVGIKRTVPRGARWSGAEQTMVLDEPFGSHWLRARAARVFTWVAPTQPFVVDTITIPAVKDQQVS